MRRFPIVCAAASFAGLFSASVCTAQTGDFDESPTRSTVSEVKAVVAIPAEPPVSLNFVDQKLALSLAVDTHSQIETAEFALKSIGNEALRRLMTSRLADHRALAERLDSLTEGRAKRAIVDALREMEADKAAKTPRAMSFRPMALQKFATSLLVRVRLEILQEYGGAVQAELAGKSANEFDRQFLRGDVLRQMQMLATLKVFESQASPDFAGVIHAAWSTANEQYEHSKGLLAQLETAPLVEAKAVVAPLAETAGAH
jgi:hypothetical protein